MRIIYHSKKKECKSPFGAVCVNRSISFRIGITAGDGLPEAECADFFIRRDGMAEEDSIAGIPIDGGFSFQYTGREAGLYFYRFRVRFSDGSQEECEEHQLTLYQENYVTPKWLTDGVMYQIFPDRYARSPRYIPPKQEKNCILREDWGGEPQVGPGENGGAWNSDFFGGNLRGIIERLDALSALGVTILYLNPVFEAFSNHRYDTADYRRIDPMLGTEEDLKELCGKAWEHGIRVILDGVFNHTGSDSIYFNRSGRFPSLGAYQSRNSRFFSWYTFSEYPNRYDCWWGIDTLPAVTETDPSYLDYILRDSDSVVRHWMRCGISGFRLDVADELPDLFLDTLREVVKEEQPDAAVIGEVWEDASNKSAYGERRRYFQGAQLDSVMNYPMKDSLIELITGKISAEECSNRLECLWENYPAPAFYALMNILGTHDTERIFTVLSKEESESEEPVLTALRAKGLLGTSARETGMRRLSSALLIWAFLPGTPCVYYGDELGMEGGRDPENRRCYVFERRKPEVYDFYLRLLNFRRRIPNLGEMEFVPASEADGFELGEDGFGFQREGSAGRILVFLNLSEHDRKLSPRLKAGERIADFFTMGYVDFSDLSTFRLGGGAGICVFLSQNDLSQNQS